MINIIKARNNVRLTKYVAEQMQEAIADQNSVYMEDRNDYNLGWLRAFEEAEAKALTEIKVAKSGGFVTKFWKADKYLREILEKEYLENKERPEPNEAIYEARMEAFKNWIVWELNG